MRTILTALFTTLATTVAADSYSYVLFAEIRNHLQQVDSFYSMTKCADKAANYNKVAQDVSTVEEGTVQIDPASEVELIILFKILEEEYGETLDKLRQKYSSSTRMEQNAEFCLMAVRSQDKALSVLKDVYMDAARELGLYKTVESGIAIDTCTSVISEALPVANDLSSYVEIPDYFCAAIPK